MELDSKWQIIVRLTLLLSITDVTLAVNNLCINGQNRINKFYINGQDNTSLLSHRISFRECDCIQLPTNVQTIALSATTLHGRGGLQICREADVNDVSGWRCMNADKFAGVEWYSESFSIKQWKRARTYRYPYRRSCRKWRQKPCKTSFRKWFWAVKQVPRVVCRIDYCAEGCKGCKTAGMGSCDSDQCMWGVATYENGTQILENGNVKCLRKCDVEVKSTGKTETPNGYVKVTDVATGVVDTWAATEAGRYIGLIDSESCSTDNRNYGTWAQAAQMTLTVLNTWKSSTLSPPEVRNRVGVDLAIGDATNGGFSFAPFIDFWKFGTDEINPLYGGRATSFRVSVSGLNGASNIVLSDVVGPN